MNGTNLSSGLIAAGASSVPYPTTSTAYIHVGNSGLSNGVLNGKIAEIVLYDAVDEDCAESIWVEGYLADKYSITLPAGHLFKNEPPANAPTTYNPSSGGGGGSSTPTAGTQVYPFRQFVEADFGSAGGGGGAVLHPLRSN